MLILNAADVRRALPMASCIAAMKRAYAALSDGRAEVPLRAHLSVPTQAATALFMPAYVADKDGNGLAVKVVSLFPHNPEQGLPFIHAAVLVLDPETGQPLALLEGGTLTAIRTAAGAGAAADILAREDSRVLAVFGAGVQARTQLEAACTVRSIETVWIYDPDQAKVETYIAELAGQGPIPSDLRKAATPEQAVADADMICTATTATTPIFADVHLRPGVHISGIGSYTPEMQEVPPETVQRALVVVDSREASLAEAGDLIQPLEAGLIDAAHIQTELGEVILGRRPGRTRAEQITFFKSVGVAVQDVMAAQLALRNAQALGLGQQVAW